MLKLDISCIIGLDLAGKRKNPSGIAIIQGRTLSTKLVYTDTEILQIIKRKSQIS